MAMAAEYRCLGCRHEWAGRPGPVSCPRCGHLYVKWVNYDLMFH